MPKSFVIHNMGPRIPTDYREKKCEYNLFLSIETNALKIMPKITIQNINLLAENICG